MWYNIIRDTKSCVMQLFYQSNLYTLWNIKLYYKARVIVMHERLNCNVLQYAMAIATTQWR